MELREHTSHCEDDLARLRWFPLILVSAASWSSSNSYDICCFIDDDAKDFSAESVFGQLLNNQRYLNAGGAVPGVFTT